MRSLFQLTVETLRLSLLNIVYGFVLLVAAASDVLYCILHPFRHRPIEAKDLC